MRFVYGLFISLTFFISCFKKNNSPDCTVPTVVPFQPFSDPVWHPNGVLLGFNHTPQIDVFSNGTQPCVWFMNSVKQDSAGFYLMNKDGTGFRRVTNFYLNTPAWSPDGNWMAFMNSGQIYKMRFTGNGFDTTNIVKLTNNGTNFFPSWTANNDTIYYDSNVGTNGQGYYVWKMASDGTGKVGFPNTGREPFVANNNLIYFVRGVLGQPEIFSMNKDGTNQTQVTFNGQYGNRRTPRFYQGNLYYEDNATLRKLNSSNRDLKLTSPCITYDISINGEIIYSKWDYSVSITNKQKGTLWIMSADGSNDRQFTYNNF